MASFRCTEAFAEWFDGLVVHCREEAGWDSIPVSAVIEKALVCLAKEKGYPIEPPRR
ncbi:MAG: hypothetical protein ACYDCI_00395 [Candidatus Limnocylindrales bacterium]